MFLMFFFAHQLKTHANCYNKYFINTVLEIEYFIYRETQLLKSIGIHISKIALSVK
jgi:hypothetical protein